MKNVFRLIGFVALAAVIGAFAASCAITSSIGGSAELHGLFTSGDGTAKTVGGTEIASYMVILGLVDVGYDEYAAKVKAAEASRRQVTTVTSWFVVFTKTVAYAL